MPTIQDCEMEQLSRLFAHGSLSNARKISRLLKAEFNEQTEVRTGAGLRSHLALPRGLLSRHWTLVGSDPHRSATTGR
jgi:hypothetical protein